MTIKQLIIILPSAIATIMPNTANCAIGGIGIGGGDKDPGLETLASCDEVTCTSSIIQQAFVVERDTTNSNCTTTPVQKCYKNNSNKYFLTYYCSSCASGYTLNSYPVNGCTNDLTSPIELCTYNCSKGYYGLGFFSSSCTQCPQWSGVYTNSAKTTLARGTTSKSGATAITDCYIAAGTYYDATGTFKISSNCQYK